MKETEGGVKRAVAKRGVSRWCAGGGVRTGIEGRGGLLELPRVAQHGEELAPLHELEHLSKKASTQDAGSRGARTQG